MAVVLVVDDGAANRELIQAYLAGMAPDGLEARRAALAEREELVARGLAHAGRFDWLETGRVHLRSYADAL